MQRVARKMVRRGGAMFGLFKGWLIGLMTEVDLSGLVLLRLQLLRER
jgi:hypothetical protein